MIYLVAFVVLVLATARLTRLIYFDDLTLPMRQWIDRKFGPNSFLSRMIWCPWCASVWASFFTSTLAVHLMVDLGLVPWLVAPGVWLFLIPAVSYPAGWIVHKETVATSRGD